MTSTSCALHLRPLSENSHALHSGSCRHKQPRLSHMANNLVARMPRASWIELVAHRQFGSRIGLAHPGDHSKRLALGPSVFLAFPPCGFRHTTRSAAPPTAALKKSILGGDLAVGGGFARQPCFPLCPCAIRRPLTAFLARRQPRENEHVDDAAAWPGVAQVGDCGRMPCDVSCQGQSCRGTTGRARGQSDAVESGVAPAGAAPRPDTKAKVAPPP